MQAGNIQIDPVALYTADELYDLDDETILSRRRTSPAVYQELQARVRREHRGLQGLVRTAHPATGAVVDAVSVHLAAPRRPADVASVAARLEEALRSAGRRFLDGNGNGDGGADGGAPTGLAEVWTPDRTVHLVTFDPAGDAPATCWRDGQPVAESPLRDLLTRLLEG